MKKEEITLKGHFEVRTSNEGNEYKILVIKLADDYDKEVYLSRAEVKLLEVLNKDSKEPTFDFDFK